MSGISTTIQLNNQMTPALNSIVASMNAMLNVMSSVNASMSHQVDATAYQSITENMNQAEEAARQLQEQIERISQPVIPQPVVPQPTSSQRRPNAPQTPVPQWTNSSIEIFKNTGVKRFAVEVNAANKAMQRLRSTQSKITTQVNNMRGLPSQMVSNISNVDSRIQELGNRIEKLNRTPVNLRTEQTNNEIETLRSCIQQATQAQIRLNSAITQMDVSSANAAYQELNSIIGETEQQIRNNIDAQEEFSGAAEKSSNAMEDLKGMLAGIGIAVGAVPIMDFANDYRTTCNSLQAQTGMTTAEINAMSESMKNIYANDLGESFEDIANSMVTVRQVTGQIGSELEATTQNALLMRDTFGFEVNESIRAAEMMVKQFGVSSEGAYNLIAQGAQLGLDKNSDLLDTVNEYSVHFKALGMNAEQMFNMLKNGVDAGAFSVDKLGDSVKEFAIRSIECSDTAIDGFKLLGLNAEEMIGRFEAGGKTASQGFDMITDALVNMKNPVDQNAAAVALFGTMAEDLGVNGVLAMSNVEGAISSTKNTLEEINTIRYDNLETALNMVGKGISVQLLEPASQIANAFIYALQRISPVINWFSQTALPTACNAIIWLVNTAMEFGEIIASNWGTIEPTISNIANTIVTMATTVFPMFADAVMTIIQLIINNFAMIEPVVSGIGNIIIMIATIVFPMLVDAIMTVINIAMQFSQLIIDNWGTIEPTISGIGNIIMFIATTIFPILLSGIMFVANAAIEVIDSFLQGWSQIAPIVFGIATALAIYTLGILANKAATTLLTKAKDLATRAQAKLNSVMLNHPFAKVAVVIGILIGVIYKWIQSVGGIKIAWMICVDKILTVWDWLAYGCKWLVSMIIMKWSDMALGIEKAKVAILNTIGNIKVMGLKLLESFVNDAIDKINAFIKMIKKIPGVSIQTIDHVEFGTKAEIAEKAAQEDRAAALKELEEKNEALKRSTEADLAKQKAKIDQDHKKRLADIEEAKKENEKKLKKKKEEKIPGAEEYEQKVPGLDDTVPGTDNSITDDSAGYTPYKLDSIDKNTKDIKKSLDITSEDLKYIRDIAEQEFINRFTTAEIKVEMINNNTVNSEVDMDGFTDKLRLKIEQEMNAVAEGAH